MIKMRCSFCKQNINRGTGKIYVQKTGKLLHFCSSKCEKNMLKLKRKQRTTKWTQEYQDIKKGTKK
ncbi:MAG: 50S ribosomal protein L24e [Nanoarchaeota archaeon]|nr:50S ribosomal protein L24e [Nanoarchaeota archaeon]MBU4284128.1 50S ribosomal protein L24e [Nanoarchaeota archaeon]MBU4493123.1 50S ribosomal protein L24e [Nanoarchaeota archaeon]